MLRRLPECKAIVTTGEKATETLCEQFSLEKPKVGDFTEFVFDGRPMRLYRMPSSSRAYPLALEKKQQPTALCIRTYRCYKTRER